MGLLSLSTKTLDWEMRKLRSNYMLGSSVEMQVLKPIEVFTVAIFLLLFIYT